MTGRGFRCGNSEIGRNTTVILPAEHRRLEASTSCDKVSQRRPGNPPTRRRRPAPSGSLTLSSPTALLSSAPEWQAQFYKTKLCPFYVRDIPDASAAHEAAAQFGHNVGSANGVCMNRDNCRFAHSFEELRPLPDLRKTKLCSSYTKKTSCKNAKCPFAHSPNELRTSSSVFYKVTLCNFYKNGRCWNGSNCRFAHGNDELRSTDQAPSDEDDELVSTTTTSTRTKKPRRPSPREKSDGLLPTPAECTRISYEKPLHKVRTAASTTSNSATTTPPGTAPQTHIPPPPFDDTETLISLVTQKLLEPQPSVNMFSSPDSIPPGFSDLHTDQSPLKLDADALVSLIFAATHPSNDTEQSGVETHPDTSYERSLTQYLPSVRSENCTEYPPLEEPYSDSYFSSVSSLEAHTVSKGNTTRAEPFTHIDRPSCPCVAEESPTPDFEKNVEDPTVRLLMSLLQGLSLDEPHSFA